MDYLNIFNAYKNKANHHEDELTRIFLTLVKNVPTIQVLFFELIRKELSELQIEEQFPSIALGDLAVKTVHTQVGNTNAMFNELEDQKVLSVIISDDRLERSTAVTNSERLARYDGVIFADHGWLIIIENKPVRDHIWLDQLNPSFKEDMQIIEKPCALSWRDIIERLNACIINGMLQGLELTLVEDFIEYVDTEFPYINPYTQFGVCKGNKYLLDKRCVALLNEFMIDGQPAQINHHQGWKDYASSNRRSIKQIALDAQVVGGDWEIKLWLYAGDTMNSARFTYRHMDFEKLKQLKQRGFSLWSNFHVSFRSSNLFWSQGNKDLSFESYVSYWLAHVDQLKQLKREQFDECFSNFEAEGFTLKEERGLIKEKILDKKYQTLNICPGIGITYTWSSKVATELDQQKMFLQDLKEKIKLVFEALGDDIDLI